MSKQGNLLVRRIGIGMTALAVILTAASILLFTMQLSMSPSPASSAWYCYGAGVFAWLLGVGFLTWNQASVKSRPLSGWLLPIVLLALVLRTAELETLPFGMWYDEALYALDTREMLQDPLVRPIAENNATFLHYLLFGISMRVVGDHQIAPVRLVQALFGVASVIMAYFVGRRLRGEMFGLCFAFILAVMRWSINFSRIGMTGIDVTFFVLLAFYALVRLTQTKHLRDALFAGAAIGFGLWFYRAFQVLLLPLMLYAILAWRWGERWQRTYAVVAVAIVTLLIIVFPLVLLIIYQPAELFGRLSETSLLRQDLGGRALLDVLGESVVKHIRMFHFQGDMNGRHNLPGAPMLDPLSGILFVGGIVLALRAIAVRQHGREHLFFIALLVVGLGASILSIPSEAPQALRSIGVVPAVGYFSALAAAWFIVWVVQTPRFGAVSSRLRVGAAAGVLALPMFALNYNTYFNQQRYDYDSFMSYTTVDTVTAYSLDDLPADSMIWASPNTALGVQAQLITPERLTQVERADASLVLPIRAQVDTALVWLIAREETLYLDEIRRLYPNVAVQTIHATDFGVQVESDDLDTLLYRVTLSPQDIAAMRGIDEEVDRGLEARYFANGDWEGDPAIVRRELFLYRYVFPLPLPRPYTARWQGSLYAPVTGSYTLGLRASAAGSLSIDDDLLIDTSSSNAASSVTLLLEMGWHSIAIRHLDNDLYSSIFLEWMPPDTDEMQPITSDFLRPS